MAKDWCGECICRYCRWRGTDNCMMDWHCPCDHCRKGSNEFFQCDGYEPSLTGRNKILLSRNGLGAVARNRPTWPDDSGAERRKLCAIDFSEKKEFGGQILLATILSRWRHTDGKMLPHQTAARHLNGSCQINQSIASRTRGQMNRCTVDNGVCTVIYFYRQRR
jgi:hypothetical protein